MSTTTLDTALLSDLLAETGIAALEKFDFSSAAAGALTFRGAALAPAHRDLLRAAQRIHRLCGDASVRDALLARGYASAHHIARANPRGFLAEMTPIVGAQAARSVRKQAGHVRAMATHMAASIRSQWGSPHYSRSMFSTLSADGKAALEAVPGFTYLFGDLDYLGCEDCQSILSPAAYFVDLMRIATYYLSDGGDELLKKRRPDLMKIALSCENTNTVIPYLAVVNPLLENCIVPPTPDTVTPPDAYQVAVQSVFPFSVPYHRPLTEIRSYLATLNTSYQALLTAFNTGIAGQVGDLEVALERLGLSQEAASLIMTPNTTNITVAALFGLTNAAGPGTVSLAKDTNVTGTGTTFSALRHGDMLTVGSQIGFVDTVISDTAATVTQAWTDAATNQSYTVATTGLVDGFLSATGLDYDQLNGLLFQNAAPSFRAGFFINSTNEALPPLDIGWTAGPSGASDIHTAPSYQTFLNLSLARLDRLARFIRLQAATGWSYEQLDYVLQVLGATTLDDKTLVQLGQLKALCDSLSTTIDIAWCLIGNLKRSGGIPYSPNADASQLDQFDAIFNNPAVVGAGLPFDPDQPLTWKVKGDESRDAANSAIRARLVAALNVADSDLDILASMVSGAGTMELKLDLPRLSQLYGAAITASLLSLTVQDYRLACALFGGADPTPMGGVTAAMLGLVDTIQVAAASPLSLAQINAIANGNWSASVPTPWQPAPANTPGAVSAMDAMISRNIAQVTGARVTAKAITSPGLDNPGTVLTSLAALGYITADGLVLDKTIDSQGAAPTIIMVPQDLAGPLITSTEAQTAFAALCTHGVLHAVKPPPEAWLDGSFTISTELGFLFPDPSDIKIGPARAQKIEAVRDALMLRSLALTNIVNSVTAIGTAQQTVVFNGLAQALAMPAAAIPSLVVYGQAVAKVENLNAQLLSASAPAASCLKAMAQAAVLVKATNLTSDETLLLAAKPAVFGQASAALTAASVLQVIAFKALVRDFQDVSGAWVNYFNGPDVTVPSKVSVLSSVTGWPQNQIQDLLTYFAITTPATVADVMCLKPVFDLQNIAGGSAEQLSVIAKVSISDAKSADGWAAWKSASTELLKAISGQTGGSFAQFLGSANTSLLVSNRSGLVDLAIFTLNGTGTGIASYQDLFDYLLVDAEMSSIVTTSKIALAISSLQVYLQRIRMGLNSTVTLNSGDDKTQDFDPEWWEWISSYRVWQANREIFLYPENYIDPTTRPDQSQIFKDFAKALQQTNLDDAAATAAYTAYLSDLEARAAMRHCGAFHYVSATLDDSTGQVAGVNADGDDVIYIFARTNKAPFDYYFRTWDGTPGENVNSYAAWTSWQPINVKIGSPYISPVYAFNRLFIFWLEVDNTKSSTVQIDTSSSAATSSGIAGGSKDLTSVKGTVKYSYLNVDKSWTPPQTMATDDAPFLFQTDYVFNSDLATAFMPAGTKPATPMPPYGSFLDTLDLDALPWQQIQAVRLPVINDTPPQNQWGTEQILINFGSALAFDPTAALSLNGNFPPSPPPPPATAPPANPDRDGFFASAGGFITAYNDMVTVAKTSGDSGLLPFHPLIRLNSALLPASCTVVVKDVDPSYALPFGPIVTRATGSLGVQSVNSLLYAEYFMDDVPGSVPGCQPGPLPAGGIVPLLNNISGTFGSVLTVKNQPGWFIYNNGDEAFLAQGSPGTATLFPLDQLIKTDPNSALVTGPVDICLACNSFLQPPSDAPPDLTATQFQFTRLTTTVCPLLSDALISGGIPALLSPISQLLPEPDFSTYKPTSQVTNPTDYAHLDFGGAYGSYFWEIFFHGPFLMATRLNAALQFEEANRWFEYIFKPQKSSTPAKAWQFYPFTTLTPDNLQTILTDDSQITAYNDDPFDPDAIAKLRISPYAKAAAMAYVGNILDWGDSMFAVDTAEAINEAMILYCRVSDILGPRPQQVGTQANSQDATFADIKTAFGSNQYDDQFLFSLENMLAAGGKPVASIRDLPFNDIPAYFCVPENDQMLALWSRLEDRLFKIRNSMNLQGVVRPLALFAPPINPRALIAAALSGNFNPLTAGLPAPVPLYRFTALMARARDMVQQVIGLGDALLSALEKGDAAQMELLRNSQEGALLSLSLAAKQQRLQELAQARQGLVQSQLNATVRQTYYQGLLTAGLNAGEQLHLSSMATGNELNIVGGAVRTIASASYLVPNLGSPFAMTWGGEQLGHMLGAVADGLETSGKVEMAIADLALTNAQYVRRSQEWKLQANLATCDYQQLAAQLEANALETLMAQNDLDAHNLSIANSQQMAQYLTSRFTNQDLYQWMAGRLSDLYFQMFNMACDMARTAESAYHFELNDNNSTFINAQYWNTERQGLTAGNQLMFALNQLQKAYLDNDVRLLEIERTVSLRDIDPQALVQLVQNGSCLFSLNELLFDMDFPGHYWRRIKSVSLSIPAILAPYQNICATLTQLSSQTITSSNIDAVKYLLGMPNAGRPSDGLQSNARASQAVALSRGTDDSGLFELDFRDERYLPFEGTGAVSGWRLDLPPASNRFDLSAISDVLIKVRYTALDGGEDFRTAVTGLPPLTAYSFLKSYNLAQAYSSEWYGFIKTGGTLTFPPDAAVCPQHVTAAKLTGATLVFMMSDNSSAYTGSKAITASFGGKPCSVSLSGDWYTVTVPEPLDLEDFKANPIAITVPGGGPVDLTTLQTIIMLLSWKGTVSW